MKFAYKVITLRETLFGDKQSGTKLEKALNEHGGHGWRAISITKADVPGRMMGHTEGLLVVFEQAYQA